MVAVETPKYLNTDKKLDELSAQEMLDALENKDNRVKVWENISDVLQQKSDVRKELQKVSEDVVRDLDPTMKNELLDLVWAEWDTKRGKQYFKSNPSETITAEHRAYMWVLCLYDQLMFHEVNPPKTKGRWYMEDAQSWLKEGIDWSSSSWNGAGNNKKPQDNKKPNDVDNAADQDFDDFDDVDPIVAVVEEDKKPVEEDKTPDIVWWSSIQIDRLPNSKDVTLNFPSNQWDLVTASGNPDLFEKDASGNLFPKIDEITQYYADQWLSVDFVLPAQTYEKWWLVTDFSFDDGEFVGEYQDLETLKKEGKWLLLRDRTTWELTFTHSSEITHWTKIPDNTDIAMLPSVRRNNVFNDNLNRTAQPNHYIAQNNKGVFQVLALYGTKEEKQAELKKYDRVLYLDVNDGGNYQIDWYWLQQEDWSLQYGHHDYGDILQWNTAPSAITKWNMPSLLVMTSPLQDKQEKEPDTGIQEPIEEEINSDDPSTAPNEIIQEKEEDLELTTLDEKKIWLDDYLLTSWIFIKLKTWGYDIWKGEDFNTSTWDGSWIRYVINKNGKPAMHVWLYTEGYDAGMFYVGMNEEVFSIQDKPILYPEWSTFNKILATMFKNKETFEYILKLQEKTES